MNPAAPKETVSESAPRHPFWGYTDVALFLGAALPSLVLAVLLLRLGQVFWPAYLSSENAKTLGVQSLAYVFLMGALYLIVGEKYQRPFWAALAWLTPTPRAHLLIMAGPALALGLASLGVVLGLPSEPSQIESLITSRKWLLVWAVVGVVLAPAFEESVFRGFLLPLVSSSVGPLAGIVLTAVPFGLLHGAQNHWAWQPVLLISVAGAMFGWVRHRTGSTAAAFLLHAAYNATEFGLYAVTRWQALR